MNALIVIDMQDAYFKTPALARAQKDLVRHINALAQQSRIIGDCIFHAKTIHSRDKQTWTLNMREDDKGFAFDGAKETKNVDGLELAGAIEVHKTRDSAFHDTDLLKQLRERNIKSITLAGVSTHSCIFQTAADAYAYDYPVRIVTAAVGDEDEELKSQALSYLAKEYRQEIIS